MRDGKVQSETQLAGGLGVVGPKIQIWTDRKTYLPGEEIRVLAMGLTSDATDLEVFVIETFTSLVTGKVEAYDHYPCPCADTNAGSVATLANFKFMTLFSKRVPGMRSGYYDFNILVLKQADGLPPVTYQNTHLRVGVLAVVEDGNPIRIDQLQQMVVGQESGAALLLRGQFPVGTPLFFFTGTAPYEGRLNPGSKPSISSSDGLTLVVPLTGPSSQGRVILMTPDGGFSTTSIQEFGPMVGAATTR